MNDSFFGSVNCKRTELTITDDVAAHESGVEVVFIGTTIFVWGVEDGLYGAFLIFCGHLFI